MPLYHQSHDSQRQSCKLYILSAVSWLSVVLYSWDPFQHPSLARCLRSSFEAIFHHTRLQVLGASYRPTTHRSPLGTPVSLTPRFRKILRTHVINSRLISVVFQSEFHSSAADYVDFFVIVLHIMLSVPGLKPLLFASSSDAILRDRGCGLVDSSKFMAFISFTSVSAFTFFVPMFALISGPRTSVNLQVLAAFQHPDVERGPVQHSLQFPCSPSKRCRVQSILCGLSLVPLTALQFPQMLL